jgi:sRNA-binding carbon storage regulator CsrA
MPLVLSLREGQDFFVDEERFVVLKIEDIERFTLRSDSGRTHKINDTMAEEVLEDVFVSSGLTMQAGVARVAIEAPHDVLILRGDNYRSGTIPKRRKRR